MKSSEVEQIYAERLQDLSNLAFETGDLDTISEELNLTVLESEPIQRGGGTGIFSNETLVEASYSDEVFVDGNNSEVIELDDSQSVVLRVLEYNEAMVLPLDGHVLDDDADGDTHDVSGFAVCCSRAHCVWAMYYATATLITT